jgi:hypothetical protein
MMLVGQGVAINGDNSLPNSNAMLDINSDSKGVLMPRLTTAQRTGIVSAVPGLTVFDSETFSYWVYLGELNGGWHELLSTLDKHWNRTGTTLYNTNPGKIGIGTSDPNHDLTINASDPAIELMNSDVTKGLVQLDGDDLKVGTNLSNLNGNLILNTKGVDRLWVTELGQVGIGTDSPSSVLTLDGINPWLELKNAGVDKGYVWATGDDLKIGTNFGNSNGNVVFQTKVVDRMVIDETGRVAIGTTAPANSSILTINDTDPIIQLENDYVSKGFVQLVANDIKIGTNASNSFGDFIIRTNGSDRVNVGYNGNVAIGYDFTSYKLAVNGNSFVDGDITIEGEAKSEEIKLIDSNSSSTGYINLDDDNNLFLGKGGVNSAGIILDPNTSSPSNKMLNISRYSHINFGSGLNPLSYTMSVEGDIIATDFTALAIDDWPDYVFDDEYELKSIDEVKDFIDVNHHLPNIPNAQEIEDNGVNLGEMSKKLIEKVEELTLYVIELNEKNRDLQKQINEMKQ